MQRHIKKKWMLLSQAVTSVAALKFEVIYIGFNAYPLQALFYTVAFRCRQPKAHPPSRGACRHDGAVRVAASQGSYTSAGSPQASHLHIVT
jgi:hypothetical protein